MRRLFIVLLMLMLGQTGSAQNTEPAQLAASTPRMWILPPDYQCTMEVYKGSGVIPRLAPAKVAAYVIWFHPLQFQYYVSDDLDGWRYWNVMSRETLDAVCK